MKVQEDNPIKSRMSYPWGRSRPFNDYSGFARQLFGERVQKISIDAGFTCPNRDGTKGRGGCTFCDNKTFNPDYCQPVMSITGQLNQGIAFFKNRYPGQKYLAYFQAYSNTYEDLNRLKAKYEEALNHPEVIGLVIGTRPDCISDELFRYLDELTDRFHITLEFGVESTNDETLRRINRGHDFQTAMEAFHLAAEYRFFTGMHLILGLPGETEESMLDHLERINRMPFHFLKLHQMQIIRGTRLAQEFNRNASDFVEFTSGQYIDFLIRFIEELNPAIIIERFISESPKEKLISPRWGLKNYEFVAQLEAEMNRRRTWQGRLFIGQ